MRTILVTALFCFALVASAQQGAVLYDEHVKFEIELPPEVEHMRHRIPTERTMQRLLEFDGSRSRMTAAPQDEEPEQLEAQSGRMRFRMMSARESFELFSDRDEGIVVEMREFMERTFLITDSPLELGWRLTGEQAEYLGYVTQRAIATTEDGTTVEAWFTPQIPTQAGPGRYGGLPGLILIVNENDGQRTFVAREVVSEAQSDTPIVAPARGRHVTREEFDAIVAERMQDMAGPRGRGTVRFHIQN